MSDSKETDERSRFLTVAYGANYAYTIPYYYYQVARGEVTNTDRSQKIRLLGICLLTFNLAMTIDAGYFAELTNWGVFLTYIKLIMTIRAAKDPELKTKYGMLAFLHILTEATLLLNVVITLVYWTVLYRIYIDYYDNLIGKVH